MSCSAFMFLSAENRKNNVENRTEIKSVNNSKPCGATKKKKHFVLFCLRGESYVALPDGPVETCVHVKDPTKLDAHKSTEESNSFVFFGHRRACMKTESLRQLRGFAVSVGAWGGS